MNPLDYPYFRQKLKGLQDQLLQLIRDQRGGTLSRAEVAAEHFDRPQDSAAQTASERELEFALSERETAELGNIQAALARLDEGTFGVCATCGDPIAAARLKATPQAPRCLSCQAKFENKRTA